jgi:hypothetical protein
MLLPALLAVLASFKPANDLYDASPLPTSPTLGNYRTAIGEFPVARLLADTLAMAAGVVFLQLLVAVLAAYALVRFSTRAGRLLLTAGSVAVLVPAQALIIPQFLIITHLGWQNTFAGLIVPQLAGCGVPLLLLRNQAQAIPASLIEAAVLDGAELADAVACRAPGAAAGPGRRRRPGLRQHLERVPVAADRRPRRVAGHHPGRPGPLPQHRRRQPRAAARSGHPRHPAGPGRLHVHRPPRHQRLHALGNLLNQPGARAQASGNPAALTA